MHALQYPGGLRIGNDKSHDRTFILFGLVSTSLVNRINPNIMADAQKEHHILEKTTSAHLIGRIRS